MRRLTNYRVGLVNAVTVQGVFWLVRRRFRGVQVGADGWMDRSVYLSIYRSICLSTLGGAGYKRRLFVVEWSCENDCHHSTVMTTEEEIGRVTLREM
jgi:hypothetical protein